MSFMVNPFVLFPAVVGGGDPFFADVVALLHLDGTDGSTTITDVTGRSWTANGNAQIDTAESKFGGASLLLDNVGDYVSTATDSALDLASFDFTIECWVKPDLAGDEGVISRRATASLGWAIQIQSTGQLIFRVNVGGTFDDFFLASATGAIVTTDFQHIAVSRTGSNFYMFIDGVQVDTNTNAGAVNDQARAMRVGMASTDNENPFSGHIDDVRVTIGTGRYTANFTPPTEAFPDS